MAVLRETIISASKDQVSTITGTDIVILGLKSGVYYGLNEVGTSVWDIIKEPIAVHDICEKIEQLYEVEPSVCEEDVVALANDLLKHNLILVHDAGSLTS